MADDDHIFKTVLSTHGCHVIVTLRPGHSQFGGLALLVTWGTQVWAMIERGIGVVKTLLYRGERVACSPGDEKPGLNALLFICSHTISPMSDQALKADLPQQEGGVAGLFALFEVI